MKNKIKLVIVAVFTVFLSSCGHFAQKKDPQGYSQAITADGIKPLHIGSPTPHKDGVYHVQVYNRSVVFMATTGLIRPSQVEVFDLDHNGTFDVVYLKQNGVWSIGFTDHFSSQHNVIADTLSSKTTYEWIHRSNEVKRSVRTASKKPSQKASPRPPSKSSTSPSQKPPIQMGTWEFPPTSTTHQ